MALPTLTEVREFILVSAPDASDAILQEIYDGELEDQQSVCKPAAFVGEYPAALRLALYRRIARTCALRGIPLGYVTSSEGGISSSAVAELDVEIRRFERPHRKLVVG